MIVCFGFRVWLWLSFSIAVGIALGECAAGLLRYWVVNRLVQALTSLN